MAASATYHAFDGNWWNHLIRNSMVFDSQRFSKFAHSGILYSTAIVPMPILQPVCISAVEVTFWYGQIKKKKEEHAIIIWFGKTQGKHSSTKPQKNFVILVAEHPHTAATAHFQNSIFSFQSNFE